MEAYLFRDRLRSSRDTVRLVRDTRTGTMVRDMLMSNYHWLSWIEGIDGKSAVVKAPLKG
jgi:hypothetical protein